MKHWLLRDAAGKRRYKVYEPDGAPSLRLTVGASNMRRNPLAATTVDAYATGALPFFDYHWRQHHGAFCAYSPWSEPPDVRALLSEFLEAEDCKLEEDEEACTVTVTAPPGKFHFISQLVSAVFHYYVAMSRAMVYPFGNPFEIPIDKRQPLRVSSPAGGSMIVTPVFRFKMAERPRGARRMDAPGMVIAILDSLGVFPRFPKALLLLFRVMAQGLARLSEQVALSVLDWWRSRFGTELATANKGDDYQRTKVQVIEEDLAVDLRHWFDTDRKCRKDSSRKTLADWESFLSNEDIPWSEREKAAAAEPLITRPNGLAYQAGGARKWFVKAVRAARRADSEPALITRTHYLRHSGVNIFLALLAANDNLSEEQRKDKKRLFGEHMGWKWPEHTIGSYSAPEREDRKLAVARDFLAGMRQNDEAIAAGHGSVVRIAAIKPTENDDELMREFNSFRLAA